MKKDLKAHPISNTVTFIVILLSFFIISYCMLFGERYQSFDEKQNEIFSLTCNIAVVEKDITEEQAKNVLKGYKELAEDHSLNASIENLGGQEILTSSDMKQGMDHVSLDCLDNVCKLINDGALCFVMHSSKSLQEVYKELTELCSNNGFEICVNEHKEVSERQTAIMEKRLYILIKYGSMIFSTAFLFISIFLWFDRRKHEWFIRNICGQSVRELLIESTEIILSFIVISYMIVVFALSVYKPDSIRPIIEYGGVGVAEAVICMILLSIKYSNFFNGSW